MSSKSVARAYALLTAVVTAIAGIALALVTTASASAAPYPPSEPCTVSAAWSGDAGTSTGASRYAVSGSGLGATQPVRVVLASSGRTLGYARTDVAGRFTTAVIGPTTTDRRAPAISAASPTQSCTWTPPSPPSVPPTLSPPGPSRTPTGTSPGGAPSAAPGGGAGVSPGPGGASVAPGSGSSGGASSAGGSGTSSPPDGSTAPAPSTGAGSPAAPPVTPPRAEPSRGTEPPFGIGLAIAAALLVLGTLAVLVLTRRPER